VLPLSSDVAVDHIAATIAWDTRSTGIKSSKDSELQVEGKLIKKWLVAQTPHVCMLFKL
jgi:hypothetical protein